MFTILRRHQRTLMLIVAILVIIAFAWLYNNTSFEKLGRDNVAQIYGRTVTQLEINRRARMFEVSARLGLFDLIGALAGGAPGRDQALQEFIINGMVFEEEARALQIQPTEAQVLAALRVLPAFQTEGQFDAAKYAQFGERVLGPNGFTERQLEEAVRHELALVRVQELLGAAAGVAPAEVRATHDRAYRLYNLAAVRLKLDDLKNAVAATEEELKKFHEQRKGQFTSTEKRRLRYVHLSLSPDQAKLEGKDRVQAMQKLSDRAAEVSLALLDPGAKFDEVAAKAGLEVKSSAELEPGKTPEEFAASPSVAAAAFRLTEAEPNSDPIPSEGGFYLLHLDSLTPSRELTFEEAREQITDAFKTARAREQLATRAADLLAKLRAATAAGKSAADAATAEGAAAESIKPFSLAEPDRDNPDLEAIIGPVLALQPGAWADPIQIPAGVLLVQLVKFEPADEAKFAERTEDLAASLHAQRGRALFQEWLAARRKAANFKAL